ncbi:MAG: hypothetical protein ACI8TP_003589 [Acidimicrobiales bacterium]|jgi:hypothetical protein
MSEAFDELASAYVDGEATSEEVARIEADPELMALVAELQAVSLSSSPLPEPDSTLRMDHIANALATFDQQQTVLSKAELPTTPVASIARARRRRTPPAWMLNAAAVLVVVGGIGLAVQQLPSDTESDAFSADAGSAEQADDASAGEAFASNMTREATASTTVQTDEAASQMAQAAEETAPVPVAPAVPIAASGDESASALLERLASAGTVDALLLRPSSTNCFSSIEAPTSGTEAGWIPIDYGEGGALLLVFEADGSLSAVLVNEACVIISID